MLLHLGPILRDVDISYSTTMFNGTFYKDTIYRQDPSPAVDAAWEALGINCTLYLHLIDYCLFNSSPAGKFDLMHQF